MEAKYLSKEKELVEVQVDGLDEGIAKLVVEKLGTDKKVGFAATSLDHPLTNNPVLRVKGSNAKESIEKALEKVLDEVEQAERQAAKLD